MTVILSNAGDSDSRILKECWRKLDAAFLEVTPNNMDTLINTGMIDTTIKNETDTLILLGHGTSFGLLAPVLESGEYILHEDNVNNINAKNVICIWCNASSFIQKFPDIHNVFATSMFISNVEEAYDYGMSVYDQDDINKVSKRCNTEMLMLLQNKTPLDEWVSILNTNADILNDIDIFNRQGLYYQL